MNKFTAIDLLSYYNRCRKNDIDQQAEREGQALNNALKPKRSNTNRIRLQTSLGKDKFDKLFKGN